MRSIIISVIFFFSIVFTSQSQQERKLIREGVKDYYKQKFSDAEVSFRKALDKNQNSFPADYNIGNSLYKQNKFKEAAGQFESLEKKEPGKKELADIYHNIGNSYFEQQQYEKSIEAYKNSLKLRPADEETRYNLAYALLKLKQQKQEQQRNNQNNKNDQQDKNKDQQNDKQDQQKDQEQNKENMNNQQQQQREDNLTKQEAEQILQAIQNQEKQVQEKVELKKTKAARIYNQKDW